MLAEWVQKAVFHHLLLLPLLVVLVTGGRSFSLARD